jgi:hypothetical protein
MSLSITRMLPSINNALEGKMMQILNVSLPLFLAGNVSYDSRK